MMRSRILFFLCLAWLLPMQAFAASLFVSPSQGSYQVGDTIRVKVLISSDVSANAVSAVLGFSSGTLQAQSVSKSGSFLSFWTTDPTFSNGSASLSLEGVSPGTGYNGAAGMVATYTFVARKAGTASISFQSGSILANDGQGTNILTDLRGATFTITAAAPKPVVEPAPTPAPEPVVATTTAPLADAPIITLGVQTVAGKEMQVVYGLSKYPDVFATLYFGKAAMTTLRISNPAADDGSFVIPIPTVLQSGTYTVQATVSRPDGGESLPSNELEVHIPRSWASYAWELIPYISIAVLILLICGALFFIFWYGSIRLLKKQHQLGKETHEAQVALHESFGLLRKDISDHLKDIRKERTLDAAQEKDILVEIKKDIDQAEGFIKRGIQNDSRSE